MLHRFALHYFSYLHRWGDQERCTNSRKDAHSPSTWPSGEQLTPLHPVPAHGSRPDQFRLTPKAPSIAIKACPVSSQTTHPEF